MLSDDDSTLTHKVAPALGAHDAGAFARGL